MEDVGLDAVAYVDAARALRRAALDEALKARVMADPLLAPVARRVAQRYVAGETAVQAIERARAIVQRGHAISLELVGESVRDRSTAAAATAAFVELAGEVGRTGLPSTISLDVSHLGLLVDEQLAVANTARVVRAAAAAGTSLMLSAEGSDRTDRVLDAYEQVARDCPAVGITLQARLRRTPEDLERVLALPGTVRLVKGAYEEPEDAALAREDPRLLDAYLALAGRLVESGHCMSLATHDEAVLEALRAQHGDALRAAHVEFEMLLGLADEALDQLRASGHRTREYVVFGEEWWLYVLNRMSEQPHRLHRALADAMGT